MYLYNLTLQRATGITHSVHGNFSGAKLQVFLSWSSVDYDFAIPKILLITGTLHDYKCNTLPVVP